MRLSLTCFHLAVALTEPNTTLPLLPATGTRLPGADSAVAEGNTLGKGPMLFHLPQSMVASLQAQVC